MKKGFFYFFRRSVMQRKGRFAIASVSVVFSVMVITGLSCITAGIRERMGEELKAYGANLIVTPAEGDHLRLLMIKTVSVIDGVRTVTGHLMERLFIDNAPIEAIGLTEEAMRNPSWRLEGRWPERSGEAVVGINLKEAFGFDIGKSINVRSDKTESPFIVRGFFERGGPEDNSIIMRIQDLQSLTGLDDRISIILVSAETGELERIKKEIEARVQGTSVKTIRQITHAEESLLRKVQLLMIIVTTVVLFAASVSVSSTMGANVLERREEIGLMKALGATRKDISRFYFTEAIFIGLSGGIGGFILGLISSEAISKAAFNSFIAVPFYLPLLSIMIGLMVALLASYFPVKDAMSYNPAVILRGE